MIIETIIAFLGLIVGLILARFTKEELKPGRKYFIWFKKIILLVLVVSLVYIAWSNMFFIKEAIGAIIGFLVGLIVAYFFKKEYFYFGLALYILAYTQSFIFITILIFLFGLPYGTLLFSKKFKYKTALFDLIMFIIPLLIFPLILFFTGNPILLYDHITLAFTAGAFFTLIFKVNKT